MPSPDEIAKRLDRRNKKVNAAGKKAKAAAKKRASGRGSVKGRSKSDPSGTLRARTKRALQSRQARGSNKSKADRKLAKREGLDINDLF